MHAIFKQDFWSCQPSPWQMQTVRKPVLNGLRMCYCTQGVLLQIFTTPLGDRPTVFLEVIQRIGCMREREAAAATTEAGSSDSGEVIVNGAAAAGPMAVDGKMLEQAGGCGGFGKGNFSELFKSIEDYERRLDIN